jgi:DNA-binding NtrC family response regulator
LTWLTNIVRDLTEPANTIRVLAAMHGDSDTRALTQIAGRAKWHVEFAFTHDSAVEMARHQEFSAILYDRDLRLLQGWRDGFQTLAATAPASCLILVSPDKDDQLWQEVIQCGGYDVLTKPFQEKRVVRSVRAACLMKSRLCAPRTGSTPGCPSD